MNVSVSPDALMRMARGFSCIFWGILLSLFLFSDKLDFHLFPFVLMPGYVLGVLLVYIGMVFLKRAGPLSDQWTRRVKQGLILLLIEVYLAPFVYWWWQIPQVPYFAANIAGLILCTTWGLFVVNRLAGEASLLLCDRAFFIETQVAGRLTAALMIILLAHALYSFDRVLLRPSGTFFFDPPSWLYAVALLPFIITMAMSWKIKERCLQVLKMSTKVPPLQSSTSEAAT